MELALLPLAAVLLLLSGASAPAPALSQRSPAAALMRHFFGGVGPPANQVRAASKSFRRHQRLAKRTPGHLTADRFTSPTLASASKASNATAQAAALHVNARKLFRTRFGFADGAYRATAPPLA